DLAVDVQLAHAAGDELRVLRPEVEDEDLFAVEVQGGAVWRIEVADGYERIMMSVRTEVPCARNSRGRETVWRWCSIGRCSSSSASTRTRRSSCRRMGASSSFLLSATSAAKRSCAKSWIGLMHDTRAYSRSWLNERSRFS